MESVNSDRSLLEEKTMLANFGLLLQLSMLVIIVGIFGGAMLGALLIECARNRGAKKAKLKKPTTTTNAAAAAAPNKKKSGSSGNKRLQKSLEIKTANQATKEKVYRPGHLPEFAVCKFTIVRPYFNMKSTFEQNWNFNLHNPCF